MLVVFEHCTEIGISSKVILAFHMPFFFFLSGILFRKSNTTSFFLSKVQKLVIPYLIYCVINMLIRVCVRGFNLGNERVLMLGGGWFVITLFFAEILYFLLISYCSRKSILPKYFMPIVLLFPSLYYCIPSFSMPFSEVPSIMLVLIAVFFIFVGDIIRPVIQQYKNNRIGFFIVMFISFSLLVFFTNKNPSSVMMYAESFGNPIIFVCGALSGIIFLTVISKIIDSHRLLEFFGRNSMAFLFIHFPIFRILQYAMNILGVPAFCSGQNIKDCIVFVMTILLCSLMIPMINRYCPFLVGRVDLSEIN